MRSYRFLALLLCSVIAPFTYAEMPAQDAVDKGTDHPLLTRFLGSKMVGYGLREFDEVMLPAGKRIENKSGQMAFSSALQLEGKYTRIAYNFPKDRSALEVMRNYQAALEKAGLKTLFACAKETCGKDFGEFFLEKRVGENFIQGASDNWEPFNYGRNDERYVLARGNRPDGSLVHIGIYTVAPVQDKNGGIFIDIVEAKAMENGKVEANLNAADLARGIATDGKVAIYGIYFDTDKTDVKPESKAALAEMAKLLQDPKLKLYVVGHTDNQGALAHNLELSQNRAESVIKVLAADYKVDVRRLSAKGVASYSPAASNDAETGREKNRRVELVKQ